MCSAWHTLSFHCSEDPHCVRLGCVGTNVVQDHTSFAFLCYCHLFYTVNMDYLTSNYRITDKRWFGRKSSWPTRNILQLFSWSNRVKQRERSISMADVPAEIRTEHIPNTSLERYFWTTLYDLFRFQVRLLNCEHWSSMLLRKVCTRLHGGIIKHTGV
jgi:hypothetical protein